MPRSLAFVRLRRAMFGGGAQAMCCLTFDNVQIASKVGSAADLQKIQPFDLVTAGANLTYTLPDPAAGANKEILVIIKGPRGGFTLNVLAFGATKIVCPTSATAVSWLLNTDGEVSYFQSDGVNWWLVG